ncbi:glycosyltransferase [Methylophilus aquaticus]|uniref:Glycosyltransferase n=1 Tax=Methylophilus aquaticus TaxID=1971610 RepID=A0ABT9JT67_9PROT|nr:glycosyltransferase [Methylophilus aquaticus]MDP8567757.1 glycosyltransferase [Methylophilus aquaticus]
MNIILIAPNFSKQKGGEAMKAFQIFTNLKKRLPQTIQITHERNLNEVVNDLKVKDVYFVKDDFVMLFLYHSIIFRLFCDAWFSYKSVKLAEQIALKKGWNNQQLIIHQTEPNSPVKPRCLSGNFLNVFGPINGNIYYPSFFYHKEKLVTKFRRKTHFLFQKLNSVLPFGIKNADLILVAGGDRTSSSLYSAGCREKQMYHTLDCGVEETVLSQPRVNHIENNYRFVQYGRVVFHKCTFLVIESLTKTKNRIIFDIVGTGPELEYCKNLVKELKLEDRVNFIPWYPSHQDLLNSLSNYRSLVFPSIEDANGIVVQEVMAMGIPAICLDWGGPQLLVEHNVDGFLVTPESHDQVVSDIAKYMDELAVNPDLAEKFSINAYNKAKLWSWDLLVDDWINQYKSLLKM